jgi:hypothetical protein
MAFERLGTGRRAVGVDVRVAPVAVVLGVAVGDDNAVAAQRPVAVAGRGGCDVRPLGQRGDVVDRVAVPVRGPVGEDPAGDVDGPIAVEAADVGHAVFGLVGAGVAECEDAAGLTGLPVAGAVVVVARQGRRGERERRVHGALRVVAGHELAGAGPEAAEGGIAVSPDQVREGQSDAGGRVIAR